ncbi:putative sodium-coupled neutral amino acid transporter 10 [Sitodiplosis mosellana]|uniref:putative sodium-coupled neutral amino acid transporter 10 n=1 Tax=Sitodiplosis mosellana TaxID=263140 RepID=UPI0024448D66|nr:putative sodium-coupled neutral amino acid transporter 10 [Sitodiplosis mosellana]
MSSNTGYIMTLANSIIGVGILAMPFCFQKCGILLSILLLILSNTITRFSCHYLLKSSIKARRKNFEFLASYIFGSSGKLMVELCVIGYLMGTCITYFVVVGDLGPQIVAKLFNINHTDSLRTFIMVLVTIFCIIPLCLLRNIESLSLMCISSIIFYFCLVLKIFFESESKMVSTYWYDNVYWWRPSGVTQCLPIFSMALSCQLQTFEIYESLPNQTIEKMNHIIKYGTGICTVVYICVGFFGYVAFYGQHFSGNILLSLTPSLASDIIEMGFVLSVAVSFPLVVFPCRASLYSLLYHRSHSEIAHYIPEHRFKYITISMVLVALIIGILIPSIELIIGLVGSTIGVAICIMFPASCFIKINKKNSTERLAAQFLLVFGFLIMILGTYANLGAIDEQQSGADVNMPIDRLPDIHVSLPTENIFITPSKMESPENKIEMGPKKQDAVVYEPSHQTKGAKRKTVKTTKSPVQNGPIREIILNKEEKDEIPVRKSLLKEPIVPIIIKSASNVEPNVIQNIQPPKSNMVANQLAEPSTDKKSTDSVINNEAIQKENLEMEIDAKEDRQKDAKRTKEILDEVKSQLTQQNELNQKLVLAKINQISETVNNIAQMQNRSVAQKKGVSQTENEVQIPIVVTEQTVRLGHDQVKPSVDKNVENLPLPAVPVAKILVDRHSSSAPSQKRVIPEPELKETQSNVISERKDSVVVDSLKQSVDELPEKVEKMNANVGRDLLSNPNDVQAATQTADTAKSSKIKTEN